MIRNIILGLLIGCLVPIGSCEDPPGYDYELTENVFVPVTPDYSDNTMWTILQNDPDDKGADVFYIPSTWEYDWYTQDGRICHYADPSRADHRADMSIEIDSVALYMAEGNNFYSPYYRHITLDSWATLNEDTISRRYNDVAFQDIKAAFRRYLSDYNNGRPFILAGFSQGGKSVVELIKTLDAQTKERMIAAYVMGYKVTPQDIVSCPDIKAAKDSLDTGVVVCYNSVSDVKYTKPIVSEPNVMCINPVNWRTDNTPGILNDTITVTLDPKFKVLVVNGFDGSYLSNILGILNVGDYHGAEPWLYSDCLRRNFRQRINSYKRKGYDG
ncbi:MAG: DUF3089 domain-containing protein [Muribaculaceae bacterium]|nr:DUF3089 domain-containing protein [Muribaculaceae bacterium]MDE6753428.1 DUF3089 domain-containing protein [Muribaculaceae bacterium]